MLNNHEYHRDEQKGANGFTEEHFWNEVSAIVATVSWAQLSDVVSTFSNLLSITVLLKAESASSDGSSNSSSNSLSNNKHDEHSHISHPVGFSLLEKHS